MTTVENQPAIRDVGPHPVVALPGVERRPIRHLRLRRRPVATDSLDRLLTVGPVAKAQGQEWRRTHRRRVVLIDAAILVATVCVAQLVALSVSPATTSLNSNWFHASAFSVFLVVCWLVVLELQQTRDISLVGIGSEEYRRVVSATVWAFGLAAVLCLLLGLQVSRGYMATALILGVAALIVGRHCVRRHLARRRMNGEFITRVVVLGRPDSVRVLSDSFNRSPATGYRIVGACVPDFDGLVRTELTTPAGIVPVLGGDRSIETALAVAGADALAVAAVEHLGPQRMRQLAWRLEAAGIELIVVPGVTDIAGHRLRMRVLEAARARPGSNHPAISHFDDKGQRVLGFRGADAAGAEGYRGFEDIFRGDEEQVRARPAALPDAVRGLRLGARRRLRARRVPRRAARARDGARGVDLDPTMVERCRQKGHDVQLADAASYLRRPRGRDACPACSPPRSSSTCPPISSTSCSRCCTAKLAPGGVVVMETVNPHSPAALKAFWTDTTHHHPLFPEVTLALCRLHGFDAGEVVLPQASGDFDEDIYVSRDYAVVARKAAG